MTNSETPVLSVQNVTKSFGGLMALNKVNFDVSEGEVTGLIGPNGAGKSTLLNVISGLYPPDSGDVVFHGLSLLGMKQNQRAAKGLARTFQLVKLFPDMTALECVMVGMHRLTKQGIFGGGLKLPAERREEARIRETSMAALREVELDTVANRAVGGFSMGMMRRVEFARALVSQPELLMLDEPVSGLTTSGTDQIRDLIKLLGDKGVSTLVVEHNVPFVMDVSHRIVVLNFGQIIADDPPDMVQEDPAVIRAYLGDAERRLGRL